MKIIIRKMEKLISLFIFINIIFYFYQIMSGKFFGDYGLVTLGCDDATSFSAIQTLSILFLNFIIWNYKEIFFEENKKFFIFNLSFLKSIILILIGIALNSRSITAVIIFLSLSIYNFHRKEHFFIL